MLIRYALNSRGWGAGSYYSTPVASRSWGRGFCMASMTRHNRMLFTAYAWLNGYLVSG